MTALDLDTPDALRAFLRLCLNGRVPRTITKLAKIMPAWAQTVLDEHAPQLIAVRQEAERLRAEANEAQRVYDKAQRAYAKALGAWIMEDQQ